MFTVEIEPTNRLMSIRVTGFWTATVMSDYAAELRAKAKALMPHGGCARILVDMSDYPIQSQEIVQEHARIVAFGKREMKARTAIVMKSALSRLQALRVADLAGQELFESHAAARRWLMEG